jgi:hypothetical protein
MVPQDTGKNWRRRLEADRDQHMLCSGPRVLNGTGEHNQPSPPCLRHRRLTPVATQHFFGQPTQNKPQTPNPPQNKTTHKPKPPQNTTKNSPISRAQLAIIARAEVVLSLMDSSCRTSTIDAVCGLKFPDGPKPVTTLIIVPSAFTADRCCLLLTRIRHQ